jgi:HTH-type transcriptional regulator / antitoxin MqsA
VNGGTNGKRCFPKITQNAVNCLFCNRQLFSKNVTFVYEHGDDLFLIRDVPAEVCTACGERTYAPEITDEIMRFARRRFEPVQQIEVPVFDYGHMV